MQKVKGFFIHYFPVFGCFSTGLIYAAIGVIAILSFLRLKDGGADETSLLAFLSTFAVGKIVVLIILLGTFCFVLWRFYEAATDPYEYGNGWKGIAKRTGIALSTVADFLIVFSAIRFLFGMNKSGSQQQLQEQQETTGSILRMENGQLWVVLIGIIVALTAFVQFFYGITRGYRERLEVEEFRPVVKNAVHFFAIFGYSARGVILGIIAYFYIKSGVLNNSEIVVNTDKAFDFIGDHIGHFWFIVIATGTICYGFFMFALARAYDSDKD